MPGSGQPSPASGNVIARADSTVTRSTGTPATRAISSTTGATIDAGSAIAPVAGGVPVAPVGPPPAGDAVGSEPDAEHPAASQRAPNRTNRRRIVTRS